MRLITGNGDTSKARRRQFRASGRKGHVEKQMGVTSKSAMTVVRAEGGQVQLEEGEPWNLSPEDRCRSRDSGAGLMPWREAKGQEISPMNDIKP